MLNGTFIEQLGQMGSLDILKGNHTQGHKGLTFLKPIKLHYCGLSRFIRVNSVVKDVLILKILTLDCIRILNN